MLEITNITKTFNPDTVNAKLALDNLSLSVKDGDFISIIGANGAGKSTLFNAIAGDFITDTGSIVLDGEDINDDKTKLKSIVLKMLLYCEKAYRIAVNINPIK